MQVLGIVHSFLASIEGVFYACLFLSTFFTEGRGGTGFSRIVLVV